MHIACGTGVFQFQIVYMRTFPMLTAMPALAICECIDA